MKAKAPIKPVLIFVKDDVAARLLSGTIPGSRVIDDKTGPLDLRRAMVDHANGAFETLIATPRWATGWRAPLDTMLMISNDFPEDLKDQARLRVPVRS